MFNLSEQTAVHSYIGVHINDQPTIFAHPPRHDPAGNSTSRYLVHSAHLAKAQLFSIAEVPHLLVDVRRQL